jgi:large subunit ribosomal protein L21e
MKGKKLRQRGKVKFSEYFKKIEDGQRVAVIKEASFPGSFPKRILGRTGVVAGTRGTYKLVQINDGDKAKTFIIHPIHLKKLNNEAKK